MSIKIYEFTFSPTKKFRVAEPYGGGQGTYITSYSMTGVNTHRFYYYKSFSGGKYYQEIWRQTDGGSWYFESRSPSTSASAVPPYTVLSEEPRTEGWTVGDYSGLTPVVTSENINTANITANAYGTVSSSRLFYDIAAQRSATATPVEGSSFIGWFLTGTETQVTTNDDFTVTDNVIALKRNPVSADIAVEARFTAVYALTTVGSANGNAYIGSSPSVITTANYPAGTSLVIRAEVTNEFYKFSKWTKGGVDYSTTRQITITTDAAASTYTAVFIPISYTLDVTPDNASHGSVSVKLDGATQPTQTGLTASSGVSYADPVISPTVVEVQATPVFGYSFTGWYVGVTLVSASATYSFNMPESNLAIEAEFTILPQSALTVTKTKGVPGDVADAKDMGSVALYHLESVLDTTSAVGTATLTSNIYTTNQYKLVPLKADARYQFDGWFQTVESAEVPIVTGGIFVVDGDNLYITAVTTDAIPVNAQFSETVLCSIATVASDSTTYTNPNPAQTGLCSCSVTAPAPDYTVGGDKWYSNQTITVEAVQGVGWELRQWLVRVGEETPVSIEKGDPDFGQTLTFTLTGDSQVIAVSKYTLPADQFQIQALHKVGQDTASGTLEIHPCGDNYVILSNGVMANVDEDSVCELTAIPANGYYFVSWRMDATGDPVVSTTPIFSFVVGGSEIFYAEFAASTEEPLVLFEGSDANRSMTWASKTFVASMPSCFSSARVYADGFPVLLSIGAAENPSKPHTLLNQITSTAASQNSFRLPTRRPEKFFMFSVQASNTVLEVAIATSMEGLKNG